MGVKTSFGGTVTNSFVLEYQIIISSLQAMGQKPTEEELFQMISEVDENMSGSIDFAEFLKVIENQKERAENFDGKMI
jgi:Ca2+-binding EF-hand superfamily protein